MCVGLSAKVVKINDGVAIIDAGGAKREISSQLIEDLEPGDYVMVHAGVAIAKIQCKGIGKGVCENGHSFLHKKKTAS